jgi:hypothetical protein
MFLYGVPYLLVLSNLSTPALHCRQKVHFKLQHRYGMAMYKACGLASMHVSYVWDPKDGMVCTLSLLAVAVPSVDAIQQKALASGKVIGLWFAIDMNGIGKLCRGIPGCLHVLSWQVEPEAYRLSAPCPAEPIKMTAYTNRLHFHALLLLAVPCNRSSCV